MSKLEELMDQEDENFRKAAAVHNAAEKKREEATLRANRLSVRKEFNRLFKRLKTMVEGHWDRYGHGWKFKYKGGDFYIAYEDWFSPKTPGDVDDYDRSGSHWVLKLGFNGIQGRTVILMDGSDRYSDNPKKDLTPEVMDGIRELAQQFARPNGRFYGENGEEN
jgi:hypothetical protein